MKSKVFENIRTRERLICDDLRNISVIDCEEYLSVRRENEQRLFLVKRSALQAVPAAKSSKA